MTFSLATQHSLNKCSLITNGMQTVLKYTYFWNEFCYTLLQTQNVTLGAWDSSIRID